MTVTLTAPVVIGILGLLAAQLVQIVVIARWSARIQTMVSKHESEIDKLRDAKHEHSSKLAGMEKLVEMLWHRVDGSPA